jgi:hypothetical protein
MNKIESIPIKLSWATIVLSYNIMEAQYKQLHATTDSILENHHEIVVVRFWKNLFSEVCILGGKKEIIPYAPYGEVETTDFDLQKRVYTVVNLPISRMAGWHHRGKPFFELDDLASLIMLNHQKCDIYERPQINFAVEELEKADKVEWRRKKEGWVEQ